MRNRGIGFVNEEAIHRRIFVAVLLKKQVVAP